MAATNITTKLPNFIIFLKGVFVCVSFQVFILTTKANDPEGMGRKQKQFVFSSFFGEKGKE